MYAKSLSDVVAAQGVRINTIAPGNILFPGGNWDRKRIADPEGVEAMITDKVPLKRFGLPEEVGNVAAFLLSDKAAFVTGACVPVDGGQLRR